MRERSAAARRFGLPVIVCGALLAGCAALPPIEGRSVSFAARDTADTRLGRAVAELLEQHPRLSGVVALPEGHDAFAARVRLADAAERTHDVPYNNRRDDTTGTQLLDALQRAADRGVRVRLLLDDNNTAGIDDVLAALDTHPNIEVRLFNPFAARRWRALGYLGDFARLNRRMHNKSFTADNQATIIGGRNVGDEYFDAGDALRFIDLDLLAIGPVVGDVSSDFDRYWASDSAYPIDRLVPRPAPQRLAAVRAAAVQTEYTPAAQAYVQALATQPFMRALLERRLAFDWATVRMVSDDPAKALGEASADELLWSRLERVMRRPEREAVLISPYFVPGDEGTRFFADLARGGVRVSVLTNSLESTDVAAVHAGYAKRRRALLEAGVRLYETKRSQVQPWPSARRLGGSSSASSLHAKTFALDGERSFVGSFNFDPRSARLNTELGFVIDCPALAQAIEHAFASGVATRAYEVRLGPSGALQWVEQRDGETIVHDEEPGTGWWQRLGVKLLSLLPIEWLL
jgi:putative cardiolipin synthase